MNYAMKNIPPVVASKTPFGEGEADGAEDEGKKEHA
jgi:hypothetical protein